MIFLNLSMCLFIIFNISGSGWGETFTKRTQEKFSLMKYWLKIVILSLQFLLEKDYQCVMNLVFTGIWFILNPVLLSLYLN